MRERPIIFSAPMVKAILDGLKTQTRRIVKGLKTGGACAGDVEELPGYPGEWFQWLNGNEHGASFECPYGVPGDRLWVREQLRGDGQPGNRRPGIVRYGADGEMVLAEGSDHPWQWKRPTLASIFMPRWASRISLDVTGVRVERLRAISEADARAEGVDGLDVGVGSLNGQPASGMIFDPRLKYAAYWDALHAKGDGVLFASDPFVWVIEFRRLEDAERRASA